MLHEIGRLSCGCDGWNGFCAANFLCVAYFKCSQSSRLELPRSRARSASTATAMAGQITMSPEKLSMLVKHEVLQTVAKIGPSEDTNSKAVDDDWAFAEKEAEQTLKTSAGSTDLPVSDKPAAQEKTLHGTQYTTTTQQDAEDPKIQHFQDKLAEWHKMFDEGKKEIFEPKFEQASGEMLIRHPPKRFPLLVLRYPSQVGRDSFAQSILGKAATPSVQCQGLGKDLPSLRKFRPDAHKCIVFDEDDWNKS